jgi:hypothetical protein
MLRRLPHRGRCPSITTDVHVTDLLAEIKATPWLADLLAARFDFDLSRDDRS